MTTLSPSSFFKDSFDSIDSIRVNYSLDISTCPSGLDCPQNSTTSRLQVEPFIEFKKSGELRLYFRVFDQLNRVSPIIIDSHVSVSHQLDTSMNSQDKDLLDAPIEDDSTPIHAESLQQQEFRNFINFHNQQNLSLNVLQSPNNIDTFQIKNTLPTNGGCALQSIEKTCFNNSNSFMPYKQKKLGREVEGFKEEFAVSTASQEHSFDNQFLFNISPASLGQSRFCNDPLPPINLNNKAQQFKNSFEKQQQQSQQPCQSSSHALLLPFSDAQRWQNPSNMSAQSNTPSTRKRGQQTESLQTNLIEQSYSELNGAGKKKACKIEEKNTNNTTAGNCKGNAVNMAKNILKGFMDYVFISAKEEDIVECCAPSTNDISSAATASPLKSLAKELGDNNEEEDEDFEDEEIQNAQPKDHCLAEISPAAACDSSLNNNDLTQQSSVEAIRKRFRKQYNQKLLEKPSNSKLLKLFANSNYGKLFRHYFSSQEIMNYIESSNIINKFAHKDLVEKIRATAFDIEKLQDVLKTRIFKRPPFQKPQK